jgi:hypothetical protein
MLHGAGIPSPASNNRSKKRVNASTCCVRVRVHVRVRACVRARVQLCVHLADSNTLNDDMEVK